jgi:hypothetical protein
VVANGLDEKRTIFLLGKVRIEREKEEYFGKQPRWVGGVW